MTDLVKVLLMVRQALVDGSSEGTVDGEAVGLDDGSWGGTVDGKAVGLDDDASYGSLG